ncbi:MAG: SH3 domain-containing protein [Saprospiraceae bacterium]|nr:SH3 domain-containing protein [Saprospiraceae bacterium]
MSGVRLSKVTAPSGLVMRTEPSRNSSKILVIPFDEELAVCEIYWPEPVSENIEGIGWGTWIKVRYQGKEGYVFDFYLDKNPQVEIIHADYTESPEFWPKPIVSISAEKPTYYGYTNLWTKTVKLQRSVMANGEVSFNIDGPEREKAKFFLCGMMPKPHIYAYISEYPSKEEILPGTYREFDFGNTRFALFATGQVVIDKSRIHELVDEGPYLLIRDYKVFYCNIDEPSKKAQLLSSKR